jgi:hypothetical protein
MVSRSLTVCIRKSPRPCPPQVKLPAKQALWVVGANHNDVAFVAGSQYSNSLQKFSELVQQYQQKAGSQKKHIAAI